MLIKYKIIYIHKQNQQVYLKLLTRKLSKLKMSIQLIKKKENKMFINSIVIKKINIQQLKKKQKQNNNNNSILILLLKNNQNKNYHLTLTNLTKNHLTKIMNQLRFILKLKKKVKNNNHLYFVDFVLAVNFMITEVHQILNKIDLLFVYAHFVYIY